MKSEQKVMVGLGEILWDLLPEGKQLGGAPANFAYHCARMGHRAAVASRVGEDELGRAILARLDALRFDATCVQIDPSHPTGTVKIELDESGQADYAIVEDVAWDWMEWTKPWEDLARQAHAVCFGSLAQRSTASRRTIRRFLNACRPETLLIFDINLRQHYFSREVLTESLRLARIAKLNDEELPRLADLMEIDGSNAIEQAEALLRAFTLDLVCVTRAERGSLLVRPGEVSEHPGIRVPVVDTVGSGDAFVAAMAHHLLLGASLDAINAAANRLGAFVATQPGATPPLPDDLLEK